MKKVSLLSLLFVLVGTLLISACSTTAAQPVAALGGTDVPVVANTPLPLSAEELSSGSPTPSRVEFSVENASLKVKVMDIGQGLFPLDWSFRRPTRNWRAVPRTGRSG
jgi:hypothetical protein